MLFITNQSELQRFPHVFQHFLSYIAKIPLNIFLNHLICPYAWNSTTINAVRRRKHAILLMLKLAMPRGR